MQTDIRNILRAAWELVANPKIGRLSLLTAGEITKLSWARAIRSYDEVPEIYKGFFHALPDDTDTSPYAVLTPTFEGFLSRENEKLIYSLDNKIYVLEKVANNVVCTCYSLENINYVEIGSILLRAWVKIRGVASNGTLTSSTLKFNAVTKYLFTPFLDRIRPAANNPEGTDLEAELSKFDYLIRLNFKFMNYARSSIMPGEKVIHPLLQPEIRAKILTLLGRPFFRTISTAHLSILTDSELIIIRDENSKGWGKTIRHGGIWNYIPLDRITSVSLTRKEDNLLTLSIHLPENDRLESLFTASNERELDLFLNKLEDLTSGITVKGEAGVKSGQPQPNVT
jgi:hypothetical protein